MLRDTAFSMVGTVGGVVAQRGAQGNGLAGGAADGAADATAGVLGDVVAVLRVVGQEQAAGVYSATAEAAPPTQ